MYNQLIEKIKVHMEVNPQVESCGIITKNYDYIPCENLSPEPKESFILDPVKFCEYADDCWGIFHSHTIEHDELPSEADKHSAIFTEYKFVMGNLNGVFYEYWLDSQNHLRFRPFTEESINVN
jgi:proteasome lid subunit RPN8/RPN11